MNIIKLLVSLSISIGLIPMSFNGAAASEKSAVAPAVLYENTCSICHDIERSKSKRKSEKSWRKTIIRMKKNGAPITEEESEIIIRHLADKYGK